MLALFLACLLKSPMEKDDQLSIGKESSFCLISVLFCAVVLYKCYSILGERISQLEMSFLCKSDKTGRVNSSRKMRQPKWLPRTQGVRDLVSKTATKESLIMNALISHQRAVHLLHL